MQVHDQLATMDAQQLRDFAAELIEKVGRQDQELRRRQLKIEQLTHEMAVMRRWKFAARSEQLHGAQRHLFEEALADAPSRRTAEAWPSWKLPFKGAEADVEVAETAGKREGQQNSTSIFIVLSQSANCRKSSSDMRS